MPAKNLQRIDEEGLYLHIFNKGVEQRTIFADEEDYKIFLSYLEDYLTAPKNHDDLKKTFQIQGRTFQGIPHQPKNYFNQVELIAYLLAPDHFHLILHQKTTGAVKNFIRSLCTRYSIYFNKKYQRSGALFDGPYKSAPVKDSRGLSHLTRYLHLGESHSSYPEYLGQRKTSWIKPAAVLASFDTDKTGYQDFVEEYEPDQQERELIDGIRIENKTEHLKRRNPASSAEISLEPNMKPRSRVPEFFAASTVMLMLLVALGVRNITVSAAKNLQPVPVTVPEVLSEKTQEAAPETALEATPEAKTALPVEETTTEAPKAIVRVKIDGSSTVNIRQNPTTSSEKIGQAKNGDEFEFASLEADWFEIKLASGSGFISAKYAQKDRHLERREDTSRQNDHK